MTAILTADERQLIAVVLPALRAAGWQPAWQGYWNRTAGLRFRVNSGGWAVLMSCDGLGSRNKGIFEGEVHSVEHAVDLAVTYGLLPHAFSSAYRAGLDAAEAFLNTPGTIPAAFELALLRHARDEDRLDITDDELLDHHRTDVYRTVIAACWIAAQASALGWDVQVNDLGDRLLVLDRIDTEV